MNVLAGTELAAGSLPLHVRESVHMFPHATQLTRRVVLAGLALALLTSAAAPLLGDHDATAGRGKARHGVSLERKGKRAKTITRTFTQDGFIDIPGGQTPGGVPANPYPSTIKVRGFKHGRVTDVDLTLRGFEHFNVLDVDILLVKEGANGAVVQVLGDVGDVSHDAVTFLTLDDEATEELPFYDELVAGTFQPTDHDQEGIDDDSFPAPAPAPAPGNDSRLSAFDGLDPNGNWRLYIVDAHNDDGGSLDGWELTLQVKEKGKKKR